MFSKELFHRRREISWIVALLTVGSAAYAAEPATMSPAHQANHDSKPRFFQADYGFTTLNNCVRALPHPGSVVGIDPQTRKLLVPGEAASQSGGGVMHFHRNGKVTVDATASEVSFSQLAVGASPSSPGLIGTCEGSYSLASGNRLSFDMNCNINVPNGVNFDLSPVAADGWISEDGNTINLSQGDAIQTVVLHLPDGRDLTTERVCVQRFALTKLDSPSRRSSFQSAADEADGKR